MVETLRSVLIKQKLKKLIMKTTLKLEKRLRNFETLTFVNDTDVFEFMFSKIKGNVFRVMRNGSFIQNRLSVLEIMQLIKLHNLQLEEL